MMFTNTWLLFTILKAYTTKDSHALKVQLIYEFQDRKLKGQDRKWKMGSFKTTVVMQSHDLVTVTPWR